MTSGPVTSLAQPLPARLRTLRTSPPPGFTGRVLARLGISGEADQYVLAEGPAGPLFVAFNAHGICHVLPAQAARSDPATFAALHSRRFGRPARPAPRPLPGLATALRTGRAGNLRYDLRGLTAFQQAVLRKALGIPRGEVRPYAWVAREIGRPGAVRAVGSALARNPVPVLIPCHRVIREDGRTGNYVFGIAMKHALLARENVRLDDTRRLARAGIRYLGSDTTNIYCFPTCHNARRITPTHRVPFHSVTEAADAGYRPCQSCRPQDARTA